MKLVTVATLVGSGTLFTLASCMSRDAAPARQEEEKNAAYPVADAPAPAAAPMEMDDAMGGEGGRARQKMAAPGDLTLGAIGYASTEDKKGESKDRQDQDERGGGGAPRAWFPESFLWLPLVETNGDGVATVPVTVPDSLTTWRVLALAQSRDGAQAGSEASFLSTLPAYVDVVVPGSLYAGDEVMLPVQVVNTTGDAMSAPLSVSATGASGSAAGALSVGAGGSASRAVRVVAGAPGTATITASFGDIDRVQKDVPVRPVGQPVDVVRSGAMAADRELEFPGIERGQFGELALTLWPGAMAVVREEVRLGGGWDEPWIRHGADLSRQLYRLALANAAAELDEDDAPPESIRAMRLRAWQPVARAARAPDIATACLVAEGLRGAEEGSLEATLRERMVDQVAREQAADGTWVTTASTIDQVLALTALCARASDHPGVRLRAQGAFDRNLPRLDDPWLAAWALASGAISDTELADRLREVVKKGLVEGEDGNRLLRPGGAPRPDGWAAGTPEGTALAALALADDPALAAELATALLGQHRTEGGWGDGFADLLALRALEASFKGATPPALTVIVEADGVEVARGTLDATQPHRAVTLLAPLSASAHKLRVRAEPGAPGLVFTARHRAYVPWTAPEGAPVQVSVTPPSGLRAGGAGQVAVRVASPSDTPVDLVVGLPAGVRADESGLEALVASARIQSFTAAEGSITLRGIEGGGWEASLPVTAALAGSLHAAPSTALDPGDGDTLYTLPPQTWRIGG